MSNLERIEKIYALGSVTRDEVNRIKTKFRDHIDYTGSDINFSAPIESEHRFLGGTGLNTACNLRQFFDKEIYLFSIIGSDSEDILDLLSLNKINSTFTSINLEAETSKAKGIIDKAENHIWLIEDSVTWGAVNLLLPSSVDTDKVFSILSPIRRAVFVKFLDWVIANEIKFMFDPGMLLNSLSKDDLIKGISSCSWLIANNIEMENMLIKTNLNLEEIIQMGAKVIITRGAKGVSYYSQDERYDTPVYTPSSVVDTSGAGDAWKGAFLGSLIATNNLEYSLKLANSWASFSIEKHGAIDGYPNREEVLKRAGL